MLASRYQAHLLMILIDIAKSTAYRAHLNCGRPRLRLMLRAAVRTAEATRAGCSRAAGPVTASPATARCPSRPT
jgi:hypothetical protein